MSKACDVLCYDDGCGVRIIGLLGYQILAVLEGVTGESCHDTIRIRDQGSNFSFSVLTLHQHPYNVVLTAGDLTLMPFIIL